VADRLDDLPPPVARAEQNPADPLVAEPAQLVRDERLAVDVH